MNTTLNVVTAVPNPTPSDAGGGSTPPSGPPSVTPTSITQVATDLGSQLKAWIASIPDLQQSHSLGKSELHATQSIPIAFVAAAANAVEASTDLEGLNKLDIGEAHSTIDYGTGYEPIVALLQKAATDLQFTIDTKKSVVATQALQVYGIAKQIVRDKTGKSLLPYVDAMKKALGRRGVKKGGTTPPPAQVPTTPPPATTPAPTTTVAPTSVSLTATVPAGSTTTHS